ncbi:GtrA family protein [Ruegeria sp.]|uniref:GtrA family protein n=1 Tax=Ruegeria sp. TaxID=1879320 RepID=UPI003C7DF4BB
MSVRSVVTFVVTGGIVTAVHVAVGLMAHHFAGLDPFNANLVAYSVAFFVSYFGHRNYSFRSPGRIQTSMPKFFVISVINLFLNQIIVFTVSDMLGQPYWASLAVMIAIVPTFTYVMSKIWAFSDGDF